LGEDAVEKKLIKNSKTAGWDSNLGLFIDKARSITITSWSLSVYRPTFVSNDHKLLPLSLDILQLRDGSLLLLFEFIQSLAWK
jgi:hypothetical protein